MLKINSKVKKGWGSHGCSGLRGYRNISNSTVNNPVESEEEWVLMEK